MVAQGLSGRLAAIARDMQSGRGVARSVDEVCAAAIELLGPSAGEVVGAGVTLVHRRSRLETIGATSPVVDAGDRLQYELEEGPCLDALWESEQVYAGDLPADDRWPSWAPVIAAEHGVHSMLCTRLFTNDEQLGALNVYARGRYAFDADDRETIQILAAHAAVAVAAAREIETLKVAVDRRTTIGKALGIVMARYDLDDDQAMATLRRLSSHQGRKLYDLAVDVVREHSLPSGPG